MISSTASPDSYEKLTNPMTSNLQPVLVENTKGNDDIRIFLQTKFTELSVVPLEDIDKLCETISRKSEGLFAYVDCVVDLLEEEKSLANGQDWIEIIEKEFPPDWTELSIKYTQRAFDKFRKCHSDRPRVLDIGTLLFSYLRWFSVLSRETLQWLVSKNEKMDFLFALEDMKHLMDMQALNSDLKKYLIKDPDAFRDDSYRYQFRFSGPYFKRLNVAVETNDSVLQSEDIKEKYRDACLFLSQFDETERNNLFATCFQRFRSAKITDKASFVCFYNSIVDILWNLDSFEQCSKFFDLLRPVNAGDGKDISCIEYSKDIPNLNEYAKEFELDTPDQLIYRLYKILLWKTNQYGHLNETEASSLLRMLHELADHNILAIDDLQALYDGAFKIIIRSIEYVFEKLKSRFDEFVQIQVDRKIQPSGFFLLTYLGGLTGVYRANAWGKGKRSLMSHFYDVYEQAQTMVLKALREFDPSCGKQCKLLGNSLLAHQSIFYVLSKEILEARNFRSQDLLIKGFDLVISLYDSVCQIPDVNLIIFIVSMIDTVTECAKIDPIPVSKLNRLVRRLVSCVECTPLYKDLKTNHYFNALLNFYGRTKQFSEMNSCFQKLENYPTPGPLVDYLTFGSVLDSLLSYLGQSGKFKRFRALVEPYLDCIFKFGEKLHIDWKLYSSIIRCYRKLHENDKVAYYFENYFNYWTREIGALSNEDEIPSISIASTYEDCSIFRA